MTSGNEPSTPCRFSKNSGFSKIPCRNPHQNLSYDIPVHYQQVYWDLRASGTVRFGCLPSQCFLPHMRSTCAWTTHISCHGTDTLDVPHLWTSLRTATKKTAHTDANRAAWTLGLGMSRAKGGAGAWMQFTRVDIRSVGEHLEHWTTFLDVRG